ncbi:trypsin-like peptidase domain-containing protein [Roseibacterium sp. SDUM158017]|uniref:trypsin-like serine peptidase n=1 Tax=Roseicyclus salinarum TaxID=3036773 RepID=UPI0024155E5A|nr:trypsin-like peptidase domain-containing protein [Roseibacterium sp. SDUM158017]MDG4649158.1 trypsin-like peptidase domain-containing protein [Roseibacterium sp. SDUM158017]
MTRMLIAALALLALAAPRAAALDPTALPGLAPRSAEVSLAAVARLRAASRAAGGCTAVLIAPDLALTAGHCARGAVSGADAMQLIFRPDRRPPAFRVTVRGVAFHADNDRGPLTARNAHADLALLQLAVPVPPEVARPIPPGAGAQAGRVAIYGYVNGGAEVLRGHPACRLGTLAPGLLGSDCRVVSGLSGSPVLSGGPGDWRLEGIAVATVGGGELRAFIADVVPWPEFAGPYALDAPPAPQAAPQAAP